MNVRTFVSTGCVLCGSVHQTSWWIGTDKKTIASNTVCPLFPLKLQFHSFDLSNFKNFQLVAVALPLKFTLQLKESCKVFMAGFMARSRPTCSHLRHHIPMLWTTYLFYAKGTLRRVYEMLQFASALQHKGTLGVCQLLKHKLRQLSWPQGIIYRRAWRRFIHK